MVRSVDARLILALSALWIFAAAAVNPVGDFPINDDWAYLYSVKALLAGEGIKFSDWAAQNLVSQVFWGAGFAALFGATYTTLRISTLVAGLIGAIALYRLFRLAKAPPGLALLGAMTGVFNPLYFNLAFSYMTDVPYAAAQFVAMWLLAEGFTSRDRMTQALGWAFGVAALLCRQVGLFIPMGVAGEAALRRPWNLRRVLVAASAVVVFLALQWGFQYWLEATGKVSQLYGRQINEMVGDLATDPLGVFKGAVRLARDSTFYLGLLALPVTVACIPAWLAMTPARFRHLVLLAVAAVSILLVVLAAHRGWLFPTWQNTINVHSGLGMEFMGTPMPYWTTVALTIGACVGSVLLATALAYALVRWWSLPRESFDVAAFAAITGLCLLAPIALIEMRFDRYLIPVLPCVLLALTPLFTARSLRWASLAGFGAVACMALLSIGGTHDHLAAKRVHWRVYSDLVKTVPPRYVDGNWVLNGAMSFGKVGGLTDYLSWFERADYMVGPEFPAGYVVVQSYPVKRWLPWNRNGDPILLIRRAPASPP